MKILFFIVVMFCQPLFGVEREDMVVDITELDFNGRGFGTRSYGYAGDEGIEVVSSPEFQGRFVLGENERHSFSVKNVCFWIKIYYN